jgi:diguanylate cyclase (GGDEF)-like protein
VTYLVRYQNLSVPQGASAVSLFAVGGLVGALVAGYLADWLIFIGFPSARILMAGACRVGVFPLMYVAFTVHNTPVMLIMFTVGAVVLTASQPPLAAARLDVLHPSLRGRGTSLDALMQSLASAASPVVFGILSDHIGLRGAFLTLIPLSALGGVVLLLFAVRSYSRDEKRVQEMVAAEATVAADPTVTVREPDISTTSDTAPLLTVDGIDVSYGMIQVLFGTTMSVRRGGCHALVGRNGVGKSTLLRSIAGLVDPTAGRISFLGTDLTGVPPEQRVKLGLTLVVGGKATFPSLSVRDNLWIGAFPFAADHDLVTARTDAVLEQMATTDGLTGLLNKRAMLDAAAQKVSAASRFGRKLSVLVVDIDFFKRVNDTHGHDVGDVVIKGLGEILKRQKRATDVVARFGGEEFVVLCEETDERGALLLAERIREELGRTAFHASGGSVRVTCSVGIATFPDAGRDWDALFKGADEAMYVSKRTGRDRSTAWAPPPKSQRMLVG